MDKFQSLFLGATMAATTMTAVAFAPSAAMAITLSGGMVIQGSVDLGDTTNSTTEYLQWTGINLPAGKQATVLGTSGDFSFQPPPGAAGFNPVLSGLTIKAENLTLTKVGTGTSSSELYEFDAVSKFFDFGSFTYTKADNTTVTGNLTFDLKAGQVRRNVTDFGDIEFISLANSPITGVFRFGNATIAMGTIEASQNIIFGTNNAGATFNLVATGLPDDGEPVPEPLTMGGLAIGAGFGAFLKKRYSKKEKQLQKA